MSLEVSKLINWILSILVINDVEMFKRKINKKNSKCNVFNRLDFDNF